MTPMRQRLLLVVGWLLAATVTGLVSAGAVSVAGGQVTDRPLRPLTAAEVAALPVANGEHGPRPVSLLPPAVSEDGGPSAIDVTPPTGLEEAEAEQTADRLAESIGASVSIPPEPTPLQELQVVRGERDEIATPKELIEGDQPVDAGELAPEQVVRHMVGGSVSVAAADGNLVLEWALPRPGFGMSLEFEDSDRLRVSFRRGVLRSVFTAAWVREGLRISLLEEPSSSDAGAAG